MLIVIDMHMHITQTNNHIPGGTNQTVLVYSTIHWLESHENQKEHSVVTSRFSHPVVMMGCTFLL